MKYIVEIFSGLFMLIWNLCLCVSMLGVSSETAEAKEYKAAVVAEIENSNFNPNVIEACVREAKQHGYELEVAPCHYGEERQMAEVCLTYHYEIPLLQISQERTTRGIAR